MSSDVKAILRLEVPVLVLLGRMELKVADVVRLIPGAIIELPKNADDELELLVNNKAIGTGRAVKIGENFGIQLSFVGDVRARVAAMGGPEGVSTAPPAAAADPLAAGVGRTTPENPANIAA
jgi:flagellar motor switch protein FliN/FliY